MKKVINCNRDDNPVINKKLKEVSVEEGLAIAEELFQILNKRGDGIGLAANQVGIDAQVAVVNVTEPLYSSTLSTLRKNTKLCLERVVCLIQARPSEPKDTEM